MTGPVIQRAPSDSRKAAAPATSSGSPKPRGCRASTRRFCASSQPAAVLSSIGVFTKPGAIALTRMAFPASSSARARVSELTAPLLIAYPAEAGDPTRLMTEEMKTREPFSPA